MRSTRQPIPKRSLLLFRIPIRGKTESVAEKGEKGLRKQSSREKSFFHPGKALETILSGIPDISLVAPNRHQSDLSRKDPRPSNLSRLARLGADLQWGNLRLSHWAFVGGGQGTLVSVAFSVLSVIFVLFWSRVCPSYLVPLLFPYPYLPYFRYFQGWVD